MVDQADGNPIPCRMHLRIGREDGRPRKIPTLPFWHDHVVFPGQVSLELPTGDYFFTLERGPEYVQANGHFKLERNANDSKRVELVRGVDMAGHGWYSGDLAVYRDPDEIELLMKAECLRFAQLVGQPTRRPRADRQPAFQRALRLPDGGRRLGTPRRVVDNLRTDGAWNWSRRESIPTWRPC